VPRRTKKLSHIGTRGEARMVDVSAKDVTAREAVATGAVTVSPEVVALLRGDGLPKGDALGVARIAGIMGAKRTADLIPLCHPLPLSHVDVTVEVGDASVMITATAEATAQTGVEMEALMAAAVAALTIYDMAKAVDREIVLAEVRLVEKTKEPA
jgi:cyclic pyranopterin phosphate synthase